MNKKVQECITRLLLKYRDFHALQTPDDINFLIKSYQDLHANYMALLRKNLEEAGRLPKEKKVKT